jgi:hypothetical protein
VRYIGLLLCLLPLGGCSYTMYLSDADQHGGTVNFVTDWAQDSAFDKAKEHCAHYDRVARRGVTNLASATMTFYCEDLNVHPLTPFGGV